MATETKVDVKEADILAAGYQVLHSKSPLFYDHYERKADLQHQTHYCPGCGHGDRPQADRRGAPRPRPAGQDHLREPGGLLRLRLLLF